MKFILREYIGMLKEDQELDTLLTDLLFNMNILPLTKPKKGRQYGVDISAVGVDPEDNRKKVFLFVVKQGNFNRTTWDTGINAIRPSINEVLDTFIPNNLPVQYKSLPKKIIVCSNGELDPNVSQNWTSFVKRHSKVKLEFAFWGMDKIVYYVEDYFISENIFPEPDKLLLRKTLAFLDVPDYDLRHFYLLVDNVLKRPMRGKQKSVKRKTRIVSLFLNILYKWSADINNYKPAVVASERLILKVWDWLRQENTFTTASMIEVYKIHLTKIQVNRAYFNNIASHCYVRDGLFRYGKTSLEYNLITWEHIGVVSIVGLTELYEARVQRSAAEGSIETASTHEKDAETIADTLANLVVNNATSSYPKYDEHLIEICLAVNLLILTKRLDDARNWILEIITGIHNAFVLTKFFPLFHTNFDKLLEIETGAQKAKVTSSMLLVMLAEYSVILDDRGLYNLIRSTISKDFPEVDLQIWFPESDTDALYYNGKSFSDTGSTKNTIELYEDFDKYKAEMIEEVKMFTVEKEMSIFKNNFYYLGFIVSRHFRTYPLPYFWRGFLPKAVE